jgi:hypothetical protein
MPEAKRLEVGSINLLRTRIRRLPIVICGFLLLMIWSFQPVDASTVGEEFINSNSFSKGTIVSLDKDDPTNITLTNLSNSDYLLGTVVSSGENSVTFAKDNAEVTVAVSGDVSVYVSDANGAISQGDFIGASWLEGVGMKSLDSNRQKLLGIAVDDFDIENAETYGEIETPDGEKTIKVGVIKVRLFDKEGPLATDVSYDSAEGLLEKIAGKQVSFAKVLSGSIIFIVSLSVASLFIVSSIRGSFESIGRNPLSSVSIYRSLLHVSGLAVLVILIGTALSYVVLVI